MIMNFVNAASFHEKKIFYGIPLESIGEIVVGNSFQSP
jgi:hypothetical protein